MIPLRDNLKSHSTPYVNIGIIVACVVVFVGQMTSEDHLLSWALVPANLVSPGAWVEYGVAGVLLPSVTAMFMHGGVLHLAFNMLFLWVFGDNVEERMGHVRYLVFYLVCGLLATATHAVVTLFSSIPMVGASGAIAGVLGAYFVLFKHAYVRALVPIFIFITVMDLPAVVFLGLWFVFQFLSWLGILGGGAGVAFGAHVGGFVAGYLLARRFTRRRGGAPPPRVIRMSVD